MSMWQVVCSFLGRFFGGPSSEGRARGPRFEGLEERLCLAAPIEISPDGDGGINVRGGDNPDCVVIQVRGEPYGKGSAVLVTSNGGSPVSFRNQTGLSVYLGGGTNMLKVNIVAPNHGFRMGQIATGQDSDYIRFSSFGLLVQDGGVIHIDTGDGNDVVFVHSDDARVNVYAGDGNDRVNTFGPTNPFGFAVGHNFYGGPGDDTLKNASGGSLFGGSGNNKLVGYGHGLFVSAEEGNNTIIFTGHTHNSVIVGGPGKHRIFAGTGGVHVSVSTETVWDGNMYREPNLGSLIIVGSASNYDSLVLPPYSDFQSLITRGVEYISRDIVYGGGKG